MNSSLFKTERLEIGNLVLADLDHFIDLQSNPNVMQFVGAPAMSKDECETDLNKVIGLYSDSKNGFCIWGVYLNQELVGTCAIIQQDDANEIGYRFREKFWRQGFGSELTEGLIRYAFDDLQLNDLWAEVDVSNTGSVKLLDKYMHRIDKVWNESDNCWDYKYELKKEEYEKIRH